MYTQHFGLQEAPFNITPDPRFLYASPAYEEAFATLRYGVRERKGFVLMVGEAGTGKTTLLHRLMTDLAGDTPFVFVFNPTLSFGELLQFICDDLGLAVKGDGDLARIQALNLFLLNLLEVRGATAALLIDEAQHLSDDALERLRLLSNLETTKHKLLQIVLVGQPELDEKLARPALRQLRQRIAVRCHLERLGARDVGPLIRFRLGRAGGAESDIFPSDAVASIARHSRGIPRLVNVLCDNSLLIAYAAGQDRVTADLVEEAAGDLNLASPSSLAVHGGLPELNVALRSVEEAARREEAAESRRDTIRPVLLGALLAVVFLVVAGAGRFYDRGGIVQPLSAWVSAALERTALSRRAP